MKYASGRRGATSSAGLLVAAGTIAALGIVALWVTGKARQAERASPPRGKFLIVDGMRVHYLDEGQGSPVVLLHGNVLRAEDFVASGVFGRLAADHRVIAIDRPGYGYSERPSDRTWNAGAQAAHLQRVLERLGVRRPVVVGHSWGTLVALELALLPQAMVERLVLVSGYYFPTLRLDVMLAAPAATPILGSILRHTLTALTARLMLKRMVKAMFSPRPVPSDFLPTVDRELLLRPGQLRAGSEDGLFMVAGAARLRDRYRSITAPVVIFAGEEDRIVDVDRQARRLHDALPGSELHALPGIGHMAHHAVPNDIVAAVGGP